VHQDANWNVIGLTDLGGRVVERFAYSPYGELTVSAETYFGDYGERSERERSAMGRASMDARVRAATCPAIADTRAGACGGCGEQVPLWHSRHLREGITSEDPGGQGCRRPPAA
jgi:hypothetical protein